MDDVWTVAAPIYDSQGKPIAAIGTSGPINRVKPKHIEFCLEETKKICAQITHDIREKSKNESLFTNINTI